MTTLEVLVNKAYRQYRCNQLISHFDQLNAYANAWFIAIENKETKDDFLTYLGNSVWMSEQEFCKAKSENIPYICSLLSEFDAELYKKEKQTIENRIQEEIDEQVSSLVKNLNQLNQADLADEIQKLIAKSKNQVQNPDFLPEPYILEQDQLLPLDTAIENLQESLTQHDHPKLPARKLRLSHLCQIRQIWESSGITVNPPTIHQNTRTFTDTGQSIYEFFDILQDACPTLRLLFNKNHLIGPKPDYPDASPICTLPIQIQNQIAYDVKTYAKIKGIQLTPDANGTPDILNGRLTDISHIYDDPYMLMDIPEENLENQE